MTRGVGEGRQFPIFFLQTFSIRGTARHLTMPYGRNAGHLDYFITLLQH